MAPDIVDIKDQVYKLIILLYRYISDTQSSLKWIIEYNESGLNIRHSFYLLAEICLDINTKESLLEAIEYADRLIEMGFENSGVYFKYEALIALKDYENALLVINNNISKVDDNPLLLIRKFQILLKMGKIEKAFELAKSIDVRSRGHCFKEAFETLDKAIETAKYYVGKNPEEKYVYGIIADIIEDIDERIKYYILANDESLNIDLMYSYEERGNPADAEKYFELAEQYQLKNKGKYNFAVKDIMYGSFARFDHGLIKRLLIVREQEDSEYGCALSLIGKAYECGLGVEKDPKKAFEYYTRAMHAGTKTCDCGTFFHAYCLMYGIGVKIDTEQAKLEILSIIDRRVEADRYCLYAIFALEGDSRFSKEKAKEYLMSQSHYPACNLLLYKLTKGTSEANDHLEQFKKNIKDRPYLEQQWYSQYIDNYDGEYIHFVTN